MTDTVWVVDDRPSQQFPLYTRGNVGEVFPTVVSPLTWSLLGGEAEHGWRDAYRDLGVALTREFGTEPMVILGVFGGYCYLNLSYLRLLGVRMPGLTVEQLDQQIFGESEAPPYATRAGDRSLAASLRLVAGTISTLRARALPDLDADKADVRTWLSGLPDPRNSSDADLIALMRDFRPRFRRLFRHHIVTSFSVTTGTSLLARLCSVQLDDPTLPMKLLAGLGSVESAAPSTAMWELGRLAAADPDINRQFDAGVAGLYDRLADEPAATGFMARLSDFLSEFGSRGPNEWEGSSPTWGTDPDLALAAIDCMRATASDHAPDEQAERLAREREIATAAARHRLRGPNRAIFGAALRSAQLFAQGRERSKTTIIRAIHGVRLAQRELARRVRERGGSDDLSTMWLVTIDELPAYTADPGAFAAIIAERSQLSRELAAKDPPFVFEGHIPDPSTWARRDESVAAAAIGAELRGIAGCPGVARGRARVVLDPADPRGLSPGEVLVAPITDPSWTPLFVAAEAVVVDVGAQMSHAVIVSRELGIPAVVSVTGATRAIRDGSLIEVDGDLGVVRVLGLP